MTRLQILTRAVRTAIAHGCQRSAICVPAWANSYRVSAKQVREVWEAELTKLPPNSNEVDGK
jgi:hypothetical protein